MQTIHLDIAQKNTIPVVYSKQGDVGRKFQAVLTDNGLPYTIPQEAGFSVWYNGSAGEGNYSMVGQRDAFSISGNTVTVELITQMLVPGGGILCLVLNAADGTQLGLWDIQYTVEAIPGMDSPEAQQYYTAFSEVATKAMEAVAHVPQILPVHRGGTGASTPEDARAYLGAATRGLVESYLRATSDAELDAYIVHFINKMPDHTVRIVSVIDDYEFYTATRMTIYRGIDCDGFPEVLVTRELASTGSTMIRTGIIEGEDGIAFSPWQWVNPPMEAGKEYCLSQYFSEQPIYIRLIDLGYLSSAASTVKTNIMGPVNTIVDAKLIFRHPDSAVLSTKSVQFSIDSSSSGNTNITIYTDTDFSSYQCFLEIRYSK